ncbi:spore germination protein [Mangrovibacillus cuniculi]|uniref:Spore germination protein n=1 Tax=Mangrovibacillus cuniculi TaxID=2593652 RepID=A0A7S8CA25_9BACI|nr:spore germination protein [Mangrovibacillus cuniculi]QPC46031.1 spore germination protein [Mangrovibacillus cuniculi]
MPAIVGIVQVVSIGSSGVLNIGDVFQVQPVSSAKTFAGAGSFNTGDGLYVYNALSNTNTYDQDAVDQPIALNV